MKTLIHIIFLLIFSLQVSAQVKAVTEKGDSLLIYDNGTWKKMNSPASEYQAPGVYIEETSSLPPAVAQVATAIPAFIGKTATYPIDGALVPVKISSLYEYESYFGTYKPYQYQIKVKQNATNNTVKIIDLGTDSEAEKQTMYYALRLYFMNGGGACYIIPIPNDVDLEKRHLSDESEAYIEALSAVRQIDEVTLLVSPDAVHLSSGYYNYCYAALNQCSELRDRFAIFDVATLDDLRTSVTDFRTGLVGDLKYGAAYMPFLNSTFSYGYDESKIEVAFEGIHTIEKHTTSLISLKKSNPNAYKLIKTALQKHTVILPPSAAVTAIYTKTDRDRGVWKAPANASITGVTKPSPELTSAEQAYLTNDGVAGKSINPIAFFTGRGTMVWGARTLEANHSEWRYVPVRRLSNTIEESVKKATNFTVFETNTADTWQDVKIITENYLNQLWRQGALQGSTPSEAYFVAIGLGRTMTTQDIQDGKMIIQIGVATIKPAEFTIIKIVHQL